ADIMVANNPEFERQSRFLGITNSRRHAGIRNRYDDVCVDMAFAGELSADPFARLIDAVPLNDAVGSGEVDVLEHAETALAMLVWHPAAHAARPGDSDLSGLAV